MIRGDQQVNDNIIPFAINKVGVVPGNYYNTVAASTLTVDSALEYDISARSMDRLQSMPAPATIERSNSNCFESSTKHKGNVANKSP
jgi:hypothetical protein